MGIELNDPGLHVPDVFSRHRRHDVPQTIQRRSQGSAMGPPEVRVSVVVRLADLDPQDLPGEEFLEGYSWDSW